MPLWEFSFCFFISYAYICTCIRRHLKGTIPSSSITWSEMGKQNIQAKKVYSSAKSTYPIPEAPEQQSQLGDMKIICPEPVWTVSDAESYHQKFEAELCGKAPTKEKHREFAKHNLGNTRRKNLNSTPLSEYYPGTAHLGFRSAETLCLRIAKIATGKICLFKLVYTSSDCIVLKKISTSYPEKFSLV